MNTLLLAVFTIASGLADSLAFTHSAKTWHGDKVIWTQVGIAAAAFGVGLIFYWIAIFFANRSGVISPEVQTIGWFAATIVGVSLFNRSFLSWPISNKLIGLAVIVLLGLLVYRTHGNT